jgi:polyferredoxin
LFWLDKANAYTMFTLFVAGNIFYYAVGITLAILLKDNRAFCKYICPITVFLKPMSYYSLIRIKCDEDKCISCGKCLKVCPMEVEVNKNARSRKNATECILCQKCTKACPTKALSV